MRYFKDMGDGYYTVQGDNVVFLFDVVEISAEQYAAEQPKPLEIVPAGPVSPEELPL